jgi:predicted membrane protein
MNNCSVSREVELSATAGGPDVDAKLLFVWAVSAGHIRGEGQRRSGI